jgi:hypothetical protein
LTFGTSCSSCGVCGEGPRSANVQRLFSLSLNMQASPPRLSIIEEARRRLRGRSSGPDPSPAGRGGGAHAQSVTAVGAGAATGVRGLAPPPQLGLQRPLLVGPPSAVPALSPPSLGAPGPAGTSLGSDDSLSRISLSTISTGSEGWGEEDGPSVDASAGSVRPDLQLPLPGLGAPSPLSTAPCPPPGALPAPVPSFKLAALPCFPLYPSSAPHSAQRGGP